MIIAFTKDWDDVPTCTTHILREMAKTIPVLWVSSIGTRKPEALQSKDLRRLLVRVLYGLRKAEWKENNLRVLKPVLIPKAESRLARWINGKIFGWYVRRELKTWMQGAESRKQKAESRKQKAESEGRRAESGEQKTESEIGTQPTLEYWCFVPNAIDLLPQKEREIKSISSKVVYYCADDWTKFHNLDGDWMQKKEESLLQRADVVFASSRYLENKLKTSAKDKVHYMSHGVEYGRFSQALDKSRPVPADIVDLPEPVVGFYGNMHPWVDVALIASLASARPDWSFVLIGEIYTDVSNLESLPNVYLAGRKEHSLLHNYCRGFDIAIIPYDMSNSRMESVNPVKTKELLAAGLPIVASDVPELRGYNQDVLTCTGVDEWLSALDKQINRKDNAEISKRVSAENWPQKVARIRENVDAWTHRHELGKDNWQVRAS